jgi:hypothetical protein
MIHPSMLAHMLSGGFMLVALFCLVRCYSKLRRLDVYQTLMLSLLFSIAIGVHGISHLGLEKEYGYNPVYSFGLQ